MNKDQMIGLLRYATTLVVFIAGLIGFELSEETAGMIVYGVALVALAAWSLWKNHSITAAAIVGDKIMEAIKRGVLTEETALELLERVEEGAGHDGAA